MSKKGNRHTSTRVSLAPLTADEALSALLKTPPPSTPKKEGKKKFPKKTTGGSR